jgi:AbrB family looped-hinge helix DNA binding protein
MIIEATLSSEGQLTMPETIRDLLGLKPGDKVVFVIRGEHVEIEASHGSILDWYGVLDADDQADLDAVRQHTRQAIAAEVVREHSLD